MLFIFRQTFFMKGGSILSKAIPLFRLSGLSCISSYTFSLAGDRRDDGLSVFFAVSNCVFCNKKHPAVIGKV